MGEVRRRLGRYKRRLLGQPVPPPRRAAPPAAASPSESPLEVKRAELGGRRYMAPAAVDWLQRLLDSADEVMTVRDAARCGEALSPLTVVMRHDIDHDIENAVRFATLEDSWGVKATYYVLPGAWYYRWDSPAAISPLTLDALERIASMGHEIGLHNDVLGDAWQTGADPVALLRQQLDELRSHGFEIVGTSSHGSAAVAKAGLRNYQVFTERGGTEPQTVTTAAGGQLTFTPVPQAHLGVEYEAYSVAQALYLSDPRARWNQPPQWAESEFLQGRGPLQVLTHPEHWALSGETLRLRTSPARRAPHLRRPVSLAAIRSAAEDPPMRIISRGDCCSRRAVSMNKDLFGGQVEYIKDEKSRSDFFVDHATVGSPTRADVLRHVAVERVKSPSQRHYLFCQTDRATLDVRDADLLVLDSYGDMNFQAWQHRTLGWRLWAPTALLRDRAAFEREFLTVGYLTLEESVRYHVALIEHYRRMNGGIPVLFLNQPIAYYDKLDSRSEFGELGARLEEEVPGLYYGVIDDAELEPDDMDSSGPGQTLHFTAASYRAMIDVALQKGLSQWMPRISAASRD
jgi:hypothetical protein